MRKSFVEALADDEEQDSIAAKQEPASILEHVSHEALTHPERNRSKQEGRLVAEGAKLGEEVVYLRVLDVVPVAAKGGGSTSGGT